LESNNLRTISSFGLLHDLENLLLTNFLFVYEKMCDKIVKYTYHCQRRLLLQHIQKRKYKNVEIQFPANVFSPYDNAGMEGLRNYQIVTHIYLASSFAEANVFVIFFPIRIVVIYQPKEFFDAIARSSTRFLQPLTFKILF
jgi:hypothetical protein